MLAAVRDRGPIRCGDIESTQARKSGWWEWNDTNHHTVLLSLSGAITGQVDNLDTGTQGYTVTLSP